ncbi:MAG: triphosphoribosyl-dephospho-CoA synthase CitG [Clostridia bacterium]|nr:triphosphoribosyl-dephospho-CoA synthase CitG [Clostridia bacterium]
MREDAIALLARRALLEEVDATPKPGLVDRENNGAHTDMTRELFIKSAEALTPHFRRFAAMGADSAGISGQELFALLRTAGLEAERDMFAATGGVNTHKGALFSIGLLCAAAGRLPRLREPRSVDSLCSCVALMTRGVCRRECGEGETHGLRAFRNYGARGARGEAESGFASVRSFGYPVLREALRSGEDKNAAHVRTLLSLMANVDDTNVLARAGAEGAELVKRRSRELLADFSPEGARELDRALTEKNISPGGCADLLAISIFLYYLCG